LRQPFERSTANNLSERTCWSRLMLRLPSRADRDHGPVFFDRSLVDALRMCAEAGLLSAAQVPPILDEYRSHRTAFVFPPWRCAAFGGRSQVRVDTYSAPCAIG
jgi:predicted ATPase